MDRYELDSIIEEKYLIYAQEKLNRRFRKGRKIKLTIKSIAEEMREQGMSMDRSFLTKKFKILDTKYKQKTFRCSFCGKLGSYFDMSTYNVNKCKTCVNKVFQKKYSEEYLEDPEKLREKNKVKYIKRKETRGEDYLESERRRFEQWKLTNPEKYRLKNEKDKQKAKDKRRRAKILAHKKELAEKRRLWTDKA
jgi:phage FluMu protein Com